jgi:hypothetical protein
VAQAISALTPKAPKTSRLRALGLLAAVIAALGANELAVLFGTGALAVLAARLLLVRLKENSTWLVLGRAAAGFRVHRLGLVGA